VHEFPVPPDLGAQGAHLGDLRVGQGANVAASAAAPAARARRVQVDS
jgi:hypothetical protein